MYRLTLVLIFMVVGIAMLPGQLQLANFTSDYPSNPVDLTHANDGSGRIFVVEKVGRILIYDIDGNRTSTPFLDISNRVNSGGERGLLGLAFHPEFATNNYFFVNYVNRTGQHGQTIISRFTANGNGTVPNSEVVLLRIDQPFNNHNGGQIHFGPQDSMLYVATGDGGSGGDPGNRAQSLNSMHGKLLRINPSTASSPPSPGYAIPSDNPFVGQTGLDEIWSYGLRNPWRFSFDPLSGDLWIGDVGQGDREEINHASNGPGINFGWKCREGNIAYDQSCSNDGGFEEPVFTYETRSADGRSVTGGVMLASDKFSSDYRGHYIFGDYDSGRLWTLASGGNRSQMSATRLDTFVRDLSAFGSDEQGNVYALSLDFRDNISRIEDINAALPVQMITAVVKRQDEKVKLEWTTGLEYNASHFVVEVRGENGEFKEVGVVPSKGDSNEPTDYLFTDLVSEPGLYFYRLKAVDLDGSYSFSMILEIQIDAKDDLIISPNPASNRVNILMPVIDQHAQIQVHDLQGRLLLDQSVGAGEFSTQLDVSGLAVGVYVVRYESEYLGFTKRLVVN